MKNYYLFCSAFLFISTVFSQDLSEGYFANDLLERPMQDLAKPAYLNAVTDPSFPSTSIRRISQATAGNFVVPMYSTIQAWNSDESLMIVYGGGAHRLLNGDDYTFIRNLDIRPDDLEAVFWHFNDPNILFYMDRNTTELIRYNVNTQTRNVLVDLGNLSGCTSGLSSGNDVQMMSWDSDVFSFRCGNNSAYYYRISTGILTQFNISNINYTAPMPFPSGNLFYHNRSVYDANGDFVRDLNISGGEHSCLGKLSNGDDAYFAISFAQGPNGGCLGTLVAHNATTGNCFAVTPTEDYDYSKSGTHISALAHKNSEGGWVAVSSMGYEKDGMAILDQELFIAKVDEFEGTVYRVAHHRSDEDDIDYWGEPHVTISPSGTRLLFGSDWSGLEDGNSVDAYVAELSSYMSSEEEPTAPIANAGSDQSIMLPLNSITMNGSGSDPDGGNVNYNWELQTGPNTPEISNTQQASVTASNLIEGTYIFRLTVTDDENESVFDEVQITVLPEEVSAEVPLANAGADQTISSPDNSVTLNGSGSDPDGGSVAYSWQLQSGPNTPNLLNAQQASATASNLVTGSYIFRLTVTDDESEMAFDDITVTVLPDDITTSFALRINTGGGEITYNGNTFIADKNYDTGSMLNRPQTGLPQPYSSIRFSPSQVMNYHIPVPNGEYMVRLHFAEVWFGATGGGLSGAGRRVFDVSLEGQIAEDNLDIFSEVGAETILVKTHKVNVTGGVLDIDFSSLGADGGTRHPIINAIEILGNKNSSVIPLVDAGQDKNIILPDSNIEIEGSGSDPDGGSVSFLWSQQSGPSQATLTNTNSKNLTASSLIQGVYSFKLTVTDDESEMAMDDITVTVLPNDTTTSFALRINAGGGEIAYNGNTFIADSNYDTGSMLNRPQTGLPQPYSSIRFSPSQVMNYDIPVPNGEYMVRLHFAEVWFGATGGGLSGAGRRVFDVSLEGQIAEDNLDIFSEVGAETILVKTHKVNVTGGVLDIDFSSLGADGGTRHPIINAIEILGNGNAIASKKSSNTMKVYSNQTAALVTINFEKPIEVQYILVFDMLGRLVESYDPNVIEGDEGYIIDVKSYQSGAYIVKIIDNQGENFEKQMLVKEL